MLQKPRHQLEGLWSFSTASGGISRLIGVRRTPYTLVQLTTGGRLIRLLKFAQASARPGENGRESASYRVNEHFEAMFNTGSLRVSRISTAC